MSSMHISYSPDTKCLTLFSGINLFRNHVLLDLNCNSFKHFLMRTEAIELSLLYF